MMLTTHFARCVARSSFSMNSDDQGLFVTEQEGRSLVVLGSLPVSTPHPRQVSIVQGRESPGPLLAVLLAARAKVGRLVPKPSTPCRGGSTCQLKACRSSCQAKISD